MLTLQSVEGKVLVEYVREEDKKTPILVLTNEGLVNSVMIEKGKVKGMVIAIGDGIIGWSLCNKKDTFNKEIAIDIAMKRALVAKGLSLKSRSSFYSRLPFSLNEAFNKMEERSEKYFKYADN